MTKCVPVSLAAVLLAACTASDSAEDGKRMDDIETRLRMPAGASSLNDYARYYGFDDQGKIVGFLISGEFYDPNNQSYDVPVGKRRWLTHANYGPAISGGGCHVVTFHFDPSTKKFEHLECNGDR